MNSYNQLFPTINTVLAEGKIRKHPKDFQVTEITEIDFSQQGEHLWLYIQKTDTNTYWLAKQLAKSCKVHPRNVAYAGLKDRHAITKQWFSVQLPEIKDIEEIQSNLPDDVKILESNWHSKKLKKGQLDFNQFEILIRDVSGSKASIETNISNIIQSGVPNYFGEQRFGHKLGNIEKAEAWFEGKLKIKSRNLKSLLLSTARSLIFNSIVAERINSEIWDKPIDGDILQLDKSHSWFSSDEEDTDEIKNRLAEFDIHLTAALWGDNQLQCSKDCAKLEEEISQQFPILLKGLQQHRMKHDRRSMRIYPLDFQFEWLDQNDFHINFKLLPGCYATTIMREILQIKDESQRIN